MQIQEGFHAYHLPHCHHRRLPEMPDLRRLSGQLNHRRPAAAQTGAVAVTLGTEKNLETDRKETSIQIINGPLNGPLFISRHSALAESSVE